ncbi:tail fiber assembly protein [Dyella sp. KRB-257]|uniref:tail fiber assembly protein n=1 Tax=Dyella sp. KRB-257 TaxID=3400915 RepID=UPI003C0B6D76
MTVYAITQTGWRAIASADDLQAGETASEKIPQSVMDAIAKAEQRSTRDALISACDWTQIPDSPLTADQRTAWVAYRQALRDVPSQAGFPETIDWPIKPA